MFNEGDSVTQFKLTSHTLGSGYNLYFDAIGCDADGYVPFSNYPPGQSVTMTSTTTTTTTSTTTNSITDTPTEPIIFVGVGIVILIGIIGMRIYATTTQVPHQRETFNDSEAQASMAENLGDTHPNDADDKIKMNSFSHNRFCIWCGEPLSVLEEEINFCSFCGEKL